MPSASQTSHCCKADAAVDVKTWGFKTFPHSELIGVYRRGTWRLQGQGGCRVASERLARDCPFCEAPTSRQWKGAAVHAVVNNPLGVVPNIPQMLLRDVPFSSHASICLWYRSWLPKNTNNT